MKTPPGVWFTSAPNKMCCTTTHPAESTQGKCPYLQQCVLAMVGLHCSCDTFACERRHAVCSGGWSFSLPVLQMFLSKMGHNRERVHMGHAYLKKATVEEHWQDRSGSIGSLLSSGQEIRSTCILDTHTSSEPDRKVSLLLPAVPCVSPFLCAACCTCAAQGSHWHLHHTSKLSPQPYTTANCWHILWYCPC
jgi:hypothetical protein